MPGFAKIGDIEGYAAEMGRPGEFEFDQVNFGAVAAVDTGKVLFNQITITRTTDSASPMLLRALHLRTSFQDGRLAIGNNTAATGTFRPTVTFGLRDVTINRVQVVWDGGSMQEEVTLAYRHIVWSVPASTASGSKPVSYSCDVPTLRPLGQ